MNTDIHDPKHAIEGSIQEVQITVPFPDSFVYSNVSAISSSSMDIRVGFGEAMPDGIAYPRVGVVMTVEHAAQLVINMIQQLKVFEDRGFGLIRNSMWREFRERAKAQEPSPSTEENT